MLLLGILGACVKAPIHTPKPIEEAPKGEVEIVDSVDFPTLSDEKPVSQAEIDHLESLLKDFSLISYQEDDEYNSTLLLDTKQEELQALSRKAEVLYERENNYDELIASVYAASAADLRYAEMFEYYHIPDELSPLAETLLIDRLVEVSRPNKEAAKEYLNKIIEHGIQNKRRSPYLEKSLQELWYHFPLEYSLVDAETKVERYADRSTFKAKSIFNPMTVWPLEINDQEAMYTNLAKSEKLQLDIQADCEVLKSEHPSLDEAALLYCVGINISHVLSTLYIYPDQSRSDLKELQDLYAADLKQIQNEIQENTMWHRELEAGVWSMFIKSGLIRYQEDRSLLEAMKPRRTFEKGGRTNRSKWTSEKHYQAHMGRIKHNLNRLEGKFRSKARTKKKILRYVDGYPKNLAKLTDDLEHVLSFYNDRPDTRRLLLFVLAKTHHLYALGARKVGRKLGKADQESLKQHMATSAIQKEILLRYLSESEKCDQWCDKARRLRKK